MVNDNLIEYLSGGNHELFHTNLLAYIARHYKNLFVKLFPEVEDILTDYDSDDVEREKKNFDLSIKNKQSDHDKDEYLLILENKMKSFPDMEQLQNYRKKGTSKAYILLSLLETDEKALIEKGWQLVKYSEVASRLRCELNKKNNQIDNFFFTFLNYYVEYLQTLSKMIEEITAEFTNGLSSIKIKEYFSTNENDNENLPNWQKLFIRKVRFQLVSEEIKKQFKSDALICNAGVVRSWIPFIDLIPYSKKELDSTDYHYWIQLYDDHIERGFAINYDAVSVGAELKKSRPKNKRQKDRADFFKNVWKACMEIDLLKKIAKTLVDRYNLISFGKEAAHNSSEFRGYIYDNAVMIDLHSDLPDISIKEFIDSIVSETKEIRCLIEKVLPKDNETKEK